MRKLFLFAAVIIFISAFFACSSKSAGNKEANTDSLIGYPVLAVRDGKIGWLSSKSDKVLIPFEYDAVIGTYFNGGGYPHSVEIVELDAENIEYMMQEAPDFNCWVLKNGKWGVIDSLGNAVIPFEYKMGNSYSNGYYQFTEEYFAIKKNGKQGVASLHSIIIPCDYDSIVDYCLDYGETFIVKNNGKYGIVVIDNESNGPEEKLFKIPCVYESIEYVRIKEIKSNTFGDYEEIEGEEGEKKAKTTDKKSKLEKDLLSAVYKARKNGKCVFLDCKGSQIKTIPNWVEDVLNYNDEIILLKSNGKWGVLSEGKCSSFEYDKMNPCFSWGYLGMGQEATLFTGLYVVQKNGKFGLVNTKLKQMLPYTSDSIFVYMDARSLYYWNVGHANGEKDKRIARWFASKNNNGKWGVLDDQGKDILGYEFDSIRSMSLNLPVSEFFGEIETEPPVVVTHTRIDFDWYTEETINIKEKEKAGVYASGLIIAYKKGKAFLFNESGKELFGNYDKINVYGKRLKSKVPVFMFKVRKNGKWGVIDYNDKPILPFEYDEIFMPDDDSDCFKVTKNGKTSKIDQNGKPCK